MAIAAGEPAGTIQRGRGGFYRSADGKPYITDPSGALVRSGDRKGQPKRLVYGSPSGAGKQIENTFNLQKWGERRVVMGLGVDLALIADCAAVARLDPDSDEFKEAADRIVVRAKEAAQAGLAADRGSHGHALTEDHDEERDWIARAEAGEILGLDVDVQRALVQAWQDCVERNGLEILAVEASCVDDTWRLAGTLDRIARCTKSLRFALASGEVVVIPSGTVLVLDVKSGKRRTRPKDGSVMYWQAYGVQIASYAQSVPYDTETETRGVWPWPISQEHALIAHLDVLGAIDGNPSCELVYVDLVAGREHGGATWLRAKEWEDRRDVFSVAQLPDDEIAAPTDPPSVVEQPAAEAATSAATNVTADAEVREASDAQPAGETTSAVTPTDPLDSFGSFGSTVDIPEPDEGDDVDQATVDTLRKRYDALPADVRKGFLKRLAEEAIQGRNGRGRVPYLLGQRASVRRFEITRGLVLLAEHGVDDEETVRCIVATIAGDVAHFPTVACGQVVGMLGAADAALFAQRCELLVTTTVLSDIDDAGRVVLRFPDPAAHAA